MPKLKHFDNEDDLLLLLLGTEIGELYPKVTTIARTRLTPDIDLLSLDPYKTPPSLVGYECKLLNRKRNVWGPIYAGLGQVLYYFRYGLDHAWLVVGVPSETPADTEDKLSEIFKFLWESRIIPRYVGLMTIREGKTRFSEHITPKDRFPASSYDSPRYMRESLFRREFVWNKKIKGE